VENTGQKNHQKMCNNCGDYVGENGEKAVLRNSKLLCYTCCKLKQKMENRNVR
jgi:formylmethanofuran dehydrogenase subunit E